MGAGIVESCDDFGKTGQAPVNADLLDHLAQRFIASGWSVKQLIREITGSRVYQLGTAHDPKSYEADPANRLNWRSNRRRLDANALRDSLLAVSGRLVLTPPPLESQIHLRVEDNRTKSTDIPKLLSPTERHRTIFRPIMHETVSADLSVFDFPEPEMVTGRRNVTTVPTQALFLMNSPLVVEHALHTARRLKALGLNMSSRIAAAYQLVLARAPSESECGDATAFLEEFPGKEDEALAAFCQTLFASAEFRYLY